MSVALPTAPAGPAADACCAPAAGLDHALDVDRVTTVARALSEPVRVRVLDVLRRSSEPVCQCEFLALFDMPQPRLSQHLKRLVDADLVQVERRQKWAYYSLTPEAEETMTAWLT